MTVRTRIASALLLLAIAPLAGGFVAGLPTAFTEIPPLTRYIDHAPFARPLFVLFGALGLLAAGLLLKPSRFGFGRPSENLKPETCNLELPSWFWIGLALNLLSWFCAWTRPSWLGPLRDHTFTPLWLGYILVMDGLVFRRTGRSMLASQPRLFLALFPVSSLVWWYFEFLNRFVQNWWYEGITQFTAGRYVLFATLCFSTVLPAVFETCQWLLSFPWFRSAYAQGPRWRASSSLPLRVVAWTGIAGLILLALAPNPMFFMTWLAPLALLGATLSLAGIRTPFSDAGRGDYGPLFALAVAALMCGFFWEMWNFLSLPKWHYSVPYVNAAHLFEMPAVGYTGYLPFGPVCWCLWTAAQQLLRTGSEDAILRPR
ncbi:MAG TPA: hypothetical protein PLE77_01485 [Kiritimatiellia bacterium]|nr:hypothetical protein [Kiritimatiellia bacterium]